MAATDGLGLDNMPVVPKAASEAASVCQCSNFNLKFKLKAARPARAGA